MPPATRDDFDEDELEQAFPGCALTHVLTMVCCDQISIAIEALAMIGAAGGGVVALSLVRRSGAFEHRLKLVDLRAGQARRLAERLAALPGVQGASVEHQLLRI
jgi:hypothetical protein